MRCARSWRRAAWSCSTARSTGNGECVMQASPIAAPRVTRELPRVVAAAAVGATVVAVVDRRPPLRSPTTPAVRGVKQGRPAHRLRGGDRRGQPGRDALCRAQPPVSLRERRHLLARARAGAPRDRSGDVSLSRSLWKVRHTLVSVSDTRPWREVTTRQASPHNDSVAGETLW
jgi:hypothetical protein